MDELMEKEFDQIMIEHCLWSTISWSQLSQEMPPKACPRLPPELWSMIFDRAWGMEIPLQEDWDEARKLFESNQGSVWPPEQEFIALATAIDTKCLPIAEWLDSKSPKEKQKGSKMLQWMMKHSIGSSMNWCYQNTEYLQTWIYFTETFYRNEAKR